MKSFLVVLLAAMTAWGQSVSRGTATNRGSATLGPSSANLYLAPVNLGGSDANPCTVTQPCLTPQHATALATPGQTVYLRGGYYFLSVPWSFGVGNSGTSSAPIAYQANGGEVPIVSGGKLISGTWTVDATINCGAGCTAYYIDQSGLSNFEALFYNGVRKARIRTTDALTYLYNAGPITVTASSMGTANTACGCPAGGFDYNGDGGIENCAYLISGTTWQCSNKFLYSGSNVPTQPHGLGLGDVEILNFEKWTVSRGRLQSAGSGTAVLNGPMVSGVNQGFIAGHRYLVENISPKDSGASLRAGEWYLDRCPGCAYNVTTPASTWRLYYLAGPNENPNTDEVIVPQQQKIVDATGLKYVTFSGITFAPLANADQQPSGGTPVAAVAVQPGSTASEIVFGAGAVDTFALGDVIAVDNDYQQQTGYVGTGIAAAYIQDPGDVKRDPNYIRRVTFNLGRIVNKTATSVLLAQSLLGGGPPAGAGAQKVIAFVDREGGAFFQEWSAVFIAEEESGGRVCFHYPRLSPSGGQREDLVEVAKPIASLALHAAFLALPHTDENDGQTVVCYRSYFPAPMAAIY